MNSHIKKILMLSIFFCFFIPADTFAIMCSEYFNTKETLSSDVIRIAQSSYFQQEFINGICNHDAAEVLYIMRAMPEIFDMKNVKVLVLGNVFVNDKTWRSHVAVYDGRGNIYDASVNASREIRPIPLSDYIHLTMNKHGYYTEVRIVDPASYLIEFQQSKESLWTLLFFGYEMEALGVYQYSAFHPSYTRYRKTPMNERAKNLLPPILRPQDLYKYLN